eukprot:scaffold10910_cov95-Isochrysis_galbana.AAC.2
MSRSQQQRQSCPLTILTAAHGPRHPASLQTGSWPACSLCVDTVCVHSPMTMMTNININIM